MRAAVPGTESSPASRAASRAVEQFGRAEGVQVDVRRGRLDGGDEIQVVVVGVTRQRSLHADLGRAEVTRLGHQGGQPLPRPRVGAGHGGRIKIPVDHVGEPAADGLLADRVGQRAQLGQLRAVRAEQGGIALVGQADRIRGRRAEPLAD
jgi:hypothetical protein